MFGQLDFDGLRVGADGSLCVQGGVCVAEPGLQLRQGMLELAQSQQGRLQLVLRRNSSTDRHRSETAVLVWMCKHSALVTCL